jgi:hypothetical protein
VVSSPGNSVLPCLGEATPRAVPDAVRDGFKLKVQERPPSGLPSTGAFFILSAPLRPGMLGLRRPRP